jgi:2',3'-cyclic-nucleotide 2'-phosphodiesterase (5'-nucleotidase family)
MSGTQLSATTSFTLAHTAANGSVALDAEVAAFDAQTGLIFVIGPDGVDAIDAATGVILGTLDTSAFGAVNSVAAKDGVIAVALQADPKTDPGVVVVADVVRLGDDVSVVARSFGGQPFVTVGAQPDQIGFTPDGTRLLTANEGEPNSYGAVDSVDPVGSVSIIDIATGAVQTADFSAFNGQEAALRAAGVRIFGPGASVAQDLEPEYVAVDPNDPTKAYVTLQEANAIAVLDLTTATFTDIIPLGFKDHGLAGNEISANDQDNVFAPATFDNVFGMYMPDGITAVDVGGTTYLITANEGDSRTDWPGFSEEARISSLSLDPTAFPDDPNDADTTPEIVEAIGRLTVTNALGDTDGDGDFDQLHVFGGRSFSVWNTDGTLVFDSGNMLDEIIATQFPGSYDENRDDNKGVEPESITIGQVGADTFVFVALERADGVAAFRMDGPADFTFAGFFTTPGDDAPEVITFIPAEDAPGGKAMLVVPNEDSATTTAYELNATFKLQLLHFSDAEAGLLASTTAPNLAALVDAFEDDYANTLILAGGDNYIPSPFFAAGTDPTVAATHTRGDNPGAADIEIHNRIGVEASTVGNHEFDFGTRVFSDAVADAAFPYLTANLDFSGDADIRGRYTETVGVNGLEDVSALAGRIVPSAVVDKGGEKIGLVGVTTQILESIASTGGVEVKGFAGDGLEANDMALLAAQLQLVIDDLTLQGVDKIILMSHLQQIAFEVQLATLLEDVDIILAAGSNTRLGDETDEAVAFPGHAADFAGTYPLLAEGADGGTTLIVNTDNEFTYLGRLVVEFDDQGRIITDSLDPAINGAYAATRENVAEAWGVDEADLDATAFAEGTKGAEVKEITDAVQAVIAAKDGEIWGFTDVYLEGERNQVRNQETNFGNLTADANAYVAQQALGAEALVVSLKNGGGIRTAIGAVDVVTGEKDPPIANPSAGKPEGAVSTLDIENSLRFNNRLVVFDTSAAGLKAILEHGFASLGNQGRFPQLGGLSISYDPGLPAGSRVLSVAAIDENGAIVARIIEDGAVSASAPALISVVTLSFLAQGGDGYPIKANGENFRYLLEDGTLGPVLDETTDISVAPTGALGEQQVLKEFLQEFHATPGEAFDQADTATSGDTRIQNLDVRDDTVLDGIVRLGSGLLAGGLGDDSLTGMGGADFLLGGLGDDTLTGAIGNDSINGGGDDDLLLGQSGQDTIVGSAGNDTVLAGTGHDSVDAGDGDDLVAGENGNDIMLGGAGLDTLTGSTGNDTIDGGADDDVLDGGIGLDSLLGGAGDDLIDGGFAADTLAGGDGNDTVLAGYGDDSIDGEDGDDLLEGSFGRDWIVGGVGEDTLLGGFSDDTLDGGADDDVVDGGLGVDSLVGGEGADTLRGDAGRDTLAGGEGDDLLTGGIAGDLFIFGAGTGHDTITDLGGNDRIRIEDAITVANEAVFDADGDGAFDDLLFTLSDGGSIALIDVTRVSIANFEFA